MQGGENRIEKCLKDFGVETKVVNRLQYTDVSASKVKTFNSRYLATF